MDSSSLTRGWTRAPLPWERRALATGPPGKFRTYLYLFRFHHGRLLASDRREEILLLGVSNIDNMRVWAVSDHLYGEVVRLYMKEIGTPFSRNDIGLSEEERVTWL